MCQPAKLKVTPEQTRVKVFTENVSSISRLFDVHFYPMAGYFMSFLADLGFISPPCRTPLHFGRRSG